MSKLKYALFTGCTAKESTPEQMMSTMAVANKLGIELIELTEASCCGASTFRIMMISCHWYSMRVISHMPKSTVSRW